MAMTIGFGRSVRALAAVALMGAAAITVSAPAQAADVDAVVRAAHFSPTTPGVDVYLGAFSGGTSRLWLSQVSYGSVSPYQRIAPGLYTVAMRPAGAASSTRPVLTWTLNARAGQAYTVAGVGAGSSVQGIVIGDDLNNPPAGKGRVRVIQAASRAPLATVRATDGPVIADRTAFATTTAYQAVPAGRWSLSAQSDGSADPLSTTSSVSVAAGASTSVLLLDSKSGGITIRTVLDSAAAGTAPLGSVPAGGGGTARAPIGGSDIAAMIALLFSGALAIVMGAGVRRRRPASARGRHVIG